MTVGGAFCLYVKTCERGHVKDFEQWSRVYNAVRYNAVIFPWTLMTELYWSRSVVVYLSLHVSKSTLMQSQMFQFQISLDIVHI